MPQSAIPDVNISIVRAREFFIKGLEHHNHQQVLSAIESLNGSLDPDLKLKFIPARQYNQMITPISLVECPNCNEEIEISKNNITNKSHPITKLQEQILNIDHNIRTISCPKCQRKIYIDLESDLTIIKKPKSKYEQEFVPAHPRIDSLYDRSINDFKFWKWARETWGILEDRCRQFRNMYSADMEADES